MKEQELIKGLKKGNEKAFKFLVEQHKALVYNKAFSMLNSEEEAEDIAQEVFVEAYLSIHRFKGDSLLSTWLYRIAINKCLDHLRKQNRKKRKGINISLQQQREDSPALQLPDFLTPGLRMENQELASALYNALERLTTNQRLAFTMHNFEDLSYKEIAATMEVSLSSVESLIHRAKVNLRKVLQKFYENWD